MTERPCAHRVELLRPGVMSSMTRSPPARATRRRGRSRASGSGLNPPPSRNTSSNGPRGGRSSRQSPIKSSTFSYGASRSRGERSAVGIELDGDDALRRARHRLRAFAERRSGLADASAGGENAEELLNLSNRRPAARHTRARYSGPSPSWRRRRAGGRPCRPGGSRATRLAQTNRKKGADGGNMVSLVTTRRAGAA